ncbi:MAG TPA: hypothetical protein VFM18_24325 [Methanosarcina sp.]|nr:hypothetical protein [Methanosarcina sp.]
MATAPDSTQPQSAYPGLPRDPGVPTNIITLGAMSDTSLAPNCFAYQRFSNRLQAYLIDYVNKIYGDYPVYH